MHCRSLVGFLVSTLLVGVGLVDAAHIGTPHFRDYFYVGQQYITQNGSQIAHGQIYVEHLTPATGALRKYPLVFIHGAGMTGTNFLNTPDDRPGWADYFMGQGYEVRGAVRDGRDAVSPAAA